MWREKSAGVKILWFWTIGTAAVLVTNVARTRMKDMEEYVKSQDEKPNSDVDETVVIGGDNTSADPADDEFIREEKKL